MIYEVAILSVPCGPLPLPYNRSGTVNLKSFIGKVLLRIKWKFKLN